ncbi:MAG: SURF1 family protein [Bdellovibrionota bacterium]
MTADKSRQKFKFSWKVTLTCCVLVALMLKASHWQWTRHLKKKIFVAELTQRLAMPVMTQESFTEKNQDLSKLLHRKVKLNGSFDFANEIILRNRRYEKIPGFYVITPFKLADSSQTVLVNRGFIPTTKANQTLRKEFHKPKGKISFYGLIKASMPRKFLAPKDPPTGGSHPWVDAWLRIDIEKIQKQMPYELAPLYVEYISQTSPEIELDQIVKSDVDKTDMLFLPERASTLQAKENSFIYPVPQVNTYIPAGRHFGYVFEWAIMAFMTVIIGLIIQLRRNK